MSVAYEAPEVSPLMLVVDDDEISLALIALMLEAEGYEVLQAPSGEDALKIAAGHRADRGPLMVLADQQMPGLCGRDLAFALRAFLPRSLLIAMSATPSVAEGYDQFVQKPLDLSALRSVLQRRQLNNSAPPVDIYAADDTAIPVLEERVYRKLQHMMSPAALTEIYEVCVRDARQRAFRMRELTIENEGEFADIRRSAHAIKGGAGMIGASRLARAAARLELESYRMSDLPELVNNLLFNCDQLQRILFTKSTLAV